MRLPFFRAKSPAGDAPKPGRPARAKGAPLSSATDEGPVEQARTWARRRLVGALVLLAVGVVGFPILFETQPRPLPVDTPILLPQGGAGRVATAPAPPANPALKPLPPPPVDAGNESATPPPTGDAEGGAARKPGAASVAASAAAPAAALATAATIAAARPAQAKAEPARPEPAKPEPVKADPPKPAPAKADASKPEAAKIEAGKAPPAPDASAAGGGRFVVQVGAFTDAERLKSVRQKLEKQGFKTYTQEIQTTGGKSTRVRIGPYVNRQEADAVAAKVKAGGLQANVLTL